MQHILIKITRTLFAIIIGALAHCASCQATQYASVFTASNGTEVASSPNNAVQFQLSRDSSSGTVRFHLSWSGTASSSDVSYLPSSWDVFSGNYTDLVTIPITDDSDFEGTETLTCTIDWAENLNDFFDYVYVTGFNSANVSIFDNDKPTVTVSKINDAGEYYQTKGKFRISRTGSTASSLSVSWSISGTAIPYPNSGSDYINEISGMSGGTIAAGNTYVDMDINPVRDLVPEGTETVVLTLSSSSNYNIGSPSSATVNIND